VVLATAESAGVPYVVTGDREIQELGQYRDITILSPRQFLEHLEREG
jgi:predicted nucleic acid-binding protein